MAAAILRTNAGNIAGDIEYTEPFEVGQLRGDLATEPALSQSHVDDGKVRQVVPAERDRLQDGAADATDLEPCSASTSSLISAIMRSSSAIRTLSIIPRLPFV